MLVMRIVATKSAFVNKFILSLYDGLDIILPATCRQEQAASDSKFIMLPLCCHNNL